MLSIIICSKSSTIGSEFEENIRETVGIEHEIITIDNSKNTLSIFSAYNKGIKTSKYPYLCFVHEDVLFKTRDWGYRTCNHLSEKSIGIIGVAGGDCITKVPTSWSASGVAKNFIQTDRININKETYEFKSPLPNIIIHEVLLLDGVWLCMRKDFFNGIRFDEKTFSGFHAYDLDICLQSKIAGYKNYVVFDVLINHKSRGSRNRDWVEAMLKIKKKWEDFLPLSVTNYSAVELELIQKKELSRLLKRMVRLGYSKTSIMNKTLGMWQNTYPHKKERDLKFRIALMKVLRFFYLL